MNYIDRFTNASIKGNTAKFDEFEISGSTYEPRGDITLNGRKVDCSAFTSLTELAMICAMCNDSAVDYNVNKVNFSLFDSFVIGLLGSVRENWRGH